MPRYEYVGKFVQSGFVSTILNPYGEDGWRAVSMAGPDQLEGREGMYFVLLEREVQATETTRN